MTSGEKKLKTAENQNFSMKKTLKFRLNIGTAYKKIRKVKNYNPFIFTEMPEIFSEKFVENKIGTTKKLRENQHLTPAANFRENSENKQIFPIS